MGAQMTPGEGWREREKLPRQTSRKRGHPETGGGRRGVKEKDAQERLTCWLVPEGKNF